MEGKSDQRFIGQVEQLVRDHMSGDEIGVIITELSKVNTEVRSTFIDQVKQLIRDYMKNEWYIISTITKALSKVSTEIRTPEFIGQVDQLIGNRYDMTKDNIRYMTAHYVSNIISLLSDIEENERSTFVGQVKQLIRDDMLDQDVLDITWRLFGMEKEDRLSFVSEVEKLIISSLNGHQIYSMILMLCECTGSFRESAKIRYIKRKVLDQLKNVKLESKNKIID